MIFHKFKTGRAGHTRHNNGTAGSAGEGAVLKGGETNTWYPRN